MSDIRCGRCGAEVKEHHQFCGSCGATVRSAEIAPGEPTRLFGPLQTPGRAKLVIISGTAGEGVTYALNAESHAMGRETGLILFPDDPYVSQAHADFSYREGTLYLSDAGSANGTYLRIREPRQLSDGDTFSCGQQIFRVDIPREEGDYRESDGTMLYLSPDRKVRLRVVQLLDGGIEGMVVSSPHGELTIGREACDLCVGDDPHLSRRHASLRLTHDGRVMLSDLGTRNGTFVRIKGEVRLTHGDYLFVGRELLRVEIAS
jgi:pSer/pThr/pTyr-binding forkhead associated (FHA) protein